MKAYQLISIFQSYLNPTVHKLKKAKDINEVYPDWKNSLFSACKNNDPIIIESILKEGGTPNIVDKDGVTPLMFASHNGHLTIVEKLIAANAEVNFLMADTQGTALFFAAQNGHLAVFEALIKAGANVNLALESGFTPLIQAAQDGHAKIVELLLKHGANINAVAKNGATALTVAAQRKNLSMVKALCHAGADVNLGVSALLLAAQAGCDDIVKFLIEKGAKVNWVEPNRGITPLSTAVFHEHLTTTKLLIEAGADVNGQAKNGMSPVHFAIIKNNSEILDLLIAAKANLDSIAMGFITPFLGAALEKNLPLLKKLVSAGADTYLPPVKEKNGALVCWNLPDMIAMHDLINGRMPNMALTNYLNQFTLANSAKDREFLASDKKPFDMAGSREEKTTKSKRRFLDGLDSMPEVPVVSCKRALSRLSTFAQKGECDKTKKIREDKNGYDSSTSKSRF